MWGHVHIHLDRYCRRGVTLLLLSQGTNNWNYRGCVGCDAKERSSIIVKQCVLQCCWIKQTVLGALCVSCVVSGSPCRTKRSSMRTKTCCRQGRCPYPGCTPCLMTATCSDLCGLPAPPTPWKKWISVPSTSIQVSVACWGFKSDAW